MKSLDSQKRLPRFKLRVPVECRAVKIRAVKKVGGEVGKKDSGLGGRYLVVDGDFFSVYVDGNWMARHEPRPGGYYVEYPDGTKSYSPPEAFEAGYQRVYE